MVVWPQQQKIWLRKTSLLTNSYNLFMSSFHYPLTTIEWNSLMQNKISNTCIHPLWCKPPFLLPGPNIGSENHLRYRLKHCLQIKVFLQVYNKRWSFASDLVCEAKSAESSTRLSTRKKLKIEKWWLNYFF